MHPQKADNLIADKRSVYWNKNILAIHDNPATAKNEVEIWHNNLTVHI